MNAYPAEWVIVGGGQLPDGRYRLIAAHQLTEGSDVRATSRDAGASLIDPDSGRRRYVPSGWHFNLRADYIVIAEGADYGEALRYLLTIWASDPKARELFTG